MKIVIILLLLVVVTGTAYDAYAQSNSERIKTIEATTAEIKDAVDGIVESLSPISDILEKLDNLLISSTTITSEMSDVRSSISGFNTALLAIQTTAESNKNQLNGLTAQVLELNSKIDTVQDTLVSEGNTVLEQRIDLLKTAVDNNNLALSTRLQTIESSLNAIEQELKAPTQTSNNLVRKTLSQDVTSYDYKISGDRRTISGNAVYFLDMRFSCDGHVLIDTVSTDVHKPQPPIIPTSLPNSNTDENYLKVDNLDLYNSKFEASAGSFIVLDRDAEFNLRPLSTGNILEFYSRQVEVNTKIADSTSSTFAFSYNIEVEYQGSPSTTCTLDTGRASNSNTALGRSDTLNLIIDTDNTSTLNQFRQIVSCDNNPVQITNIKGSVIDSSWDSSLVRFAEFNLEFPNDPSSDTKIGFDSDGSVSSSTYPISFSNSDMVVTGNFPLVNQLLVQIDYSTVTGGSCTTR